MGKVVRFRPPARRRLPAAWQPFVRRRAPTFAEWRMMIWAGLLMGLLLAQAVRLAQTWPASTAADSGALSQPLSLRGFGGAVRVIDGDTFEYRGDRIRIADIDTPELAGRCASEIALARRATDRLRELLTAGPFELHSVSGRDEDRFGRKLRIVTRAGASLGDRLVAEGLARTWSGRREPWC